MDVILLVKSLKSSSKRMESNTLPLPHIILRLTDWLNVLDFCSTTELPIDQQQELLHIKRRLDVVPDVERINRDLQLELFLPTESSTSTETQNPTVLEAEPTPLTSTEAHSATDLVEAPISTSFRYPSRDRKPPDRYTYTS